MDAVIGYRESPYAGLRFHGFMEAPSLSKVRQKIEWLSIFWSRVRSTISQRSNNHRDRWPGSYRRLGGESVVGDEQIESI